MSSPSKKTLIHGIHIPFPNGKTPFPQQMDVMKKMIGACMESENALLESPTGTGKTLALLCASLAWQKHDANLIREADKKEEEVEEEEGKEEPSPLPPVAPAPYNSSSFRPSYTTIYYCSRTHTQLKQVVAELKTCAPELLTGPEVQKFAGSPTPSLKMVVLGSREQYCVNPTVRMVPGSRNDACREAVKHSECSWQKGYQSLALRTTGKIQDVEDLMSDGKMLIGCAYYASKVRAKDAHMIFLPYNYILDASIRRSMEIDLKNSVVIFDEAHNVEDVARDAASIELSSSAFRGTIAQLRGAISRFPAYEEQLACLAKMLEELFDWFTHRPVVTSDNFLMSESGYVLKGKAALTEWQKHGSKTLGVPGDESTNSLIFNQGTLYKYLACLDRLKEPRGEETTSSSSSAAATKEEEEDDDNGIVGSGPVLDAAMLESKQNEIVNSSVTSFLESLLTRLSFMIGNEFKYIEDFRIGTISKWSNDLDTGTGESIFGGSGQKRTRNSGNELYFSIWCMNPAVAFHSIRETARTIALTSGTLSPLDTFAGELGCKFKFRVEASHVCDVASRLFASSYKVSGSQLLDSSYKNNSNSAYVKALGESIYTACKVTPGGVLIFFNSYAMMDKCSENWKSNGLWDKLANVKPIFLESRENPKEFDATIKQYRLKCKDKKGAQLFSVFRGKISEGIDFRDEAARAVIIVGIPYPNVKDIVIGLKKDYQNSKNNGFSGNDWYGQQAFRALNQAIGRVIRHKNDYGAILLFDHRFTENRTISQLSSWVKNEVKRRDNTENLPRFLKDFFGAFENETA